MESNEAIDDFAKTGLALVPGALTADECVAVSNHIAALPPNAAGTRCMLSHSWCATLANKLRTQFAIASLVPLKFVACQCTYFEKSAERNWLVGFHQDLAIPVLERINEPNLSGWSQKEGDLYVNASQRLLEQLIAVRLHIDPCTVDDGPLRVLAGSHLLGRINAQQVLDHIKGIEPTTCVAEQGSALLMRPLLLHASSKSRGTGKRRVLHFLFGPRELPYGLRWARQV
jgi:hypothetical protein